MNILIHNRMYHLTTKTREGFEGGGEGAGRWVRGREEVVGFLIHKHAQGLYMFMPRDRAWLDYELAMRNKSKGTRVTAKREYSFEYRTDYNSETLTNTESK